MCANEVLLSYLPSPVVASRETEGGESFFFNSPEKSIGRVCGFQGNFGVLVRAYTYIRSMGNLGLSEVSTNAVLNANYLLQCLKDTYHLPYDRRCMHEVVLSARDQKARGVHGIEIAKRLLDYGLHAPTMYFPLIVDEALMIEPTETESKETLDAFIQTLKAIDQEVSETPRW